MGIDRWPVGYAAQAGAIVLAYRITNLPLVSRQDQISGEQTRRDIGVVGFLFRIFPGEFLLLITVTQNHTQHDTTGGLRSRSFYPSRRALYLGAQPRAT